MIASARRRAAEVGEPRLAPPFPLEECDRAVVEQVLAKPRAGFGGIELYPDLASKTAALLYGLSKSQPCDEGNKRIALLLSVAFVRNNGGDLSLRQGSSQVRFSELPRRIRLTMTWWSQISENGWLRD